MTKPYRHGENIQFRLVHRWFLIFPYKALQFREKVKWQQRETGLSPRDRESWTNWHDIYVE